MPLPKGKHIGFHEHERNFSAMDKLCMYSHVQNNIVPNSNHQNKVFAPTAARALMIAHADPFNTLESSLWTSGFIGCGWGRKSTWASLATQSRLGSALRAASSLVWSMAFLGKQQHKITKNSQHQIAIHMQDVPSVTFRTTRSTRLYAQLMRRAGCHDSS